MIQAEEAISPDQVVPGIKNPNRLIVYYPRGQQATILGWNGTHTIVDVLSEENGFFWWVREGSTLVNPTDRPDLPACKILVHNVG
jgi:hypothetical protein